MFDGWCTPTDAPYNRHTNHLVPSTTCRQELAECLDIVNRFWGCQRVALGVFEPHDRQHPRHQCQRVLDVFADIQHRGWGQRPSWPHLETIYLVSLAVLLCLSHSLRFAWIVQSFTRPPSPVVVAHMDERIPTCISRDCYRVLFCWRRALYIFFWTGMVSRVCSCLTPYSICLISEPHHVGGHRDHDGMSI